MADTAKQTKRVPIHPRTLDALIAALTPEKKAALKAAVEGVLAIGAEAAERVAAERLSKEAA